MKLPYNYSFPWVKDSFNYNATPFFYDTGSPWGYNGAWGGSAPYRPVESEGSLTPIPSPRHWYWERLQSSGSSASAYTSGGRLQGGLSGSSDLGYLRMQPRTFPETSAAVFAESFDFVRLILGTSFVREIGVRCGPLLDSPGLAPFSTELDFSFIALDTFEGISPSYTTLMLYAAEHGGVVTPDMISLVNGVTVAVFLPSVNIKFHLNVSQSDIDSNVALGNSLGSEYPIEGLPPNLGTMTYGGLNEGDSFAQVGCMVEGSVTRYSADLTAFGASFAGYGIKVFRVEDTFDCNIGTFRDRKNYRTVIENLNGELLSGYSVAFFSPTGGSRYGRYLGTDPSFIPFKDIMNEALTAAGASAGKVDYTSSIFQGNGAGYLGFYTGYNSLDFYNHGFYLPDRSGFNIGRIGM